MITHSNSVFLRFFENVLFTVFVCLGLITSVVAEETLSLQIGESYDQVIAKLGSPSGTIKAGQRQVLTYPDGILEFRDHLLFKIGRDFVAKHQARQKHMAFVEEQTKKGLVPYGDQWLSPEEKRLKVEAEQNRENVSDLSDVLTYQIHVKMFDRANGYFSGPVRAKAYQDALNDKGYRMSPERCVGYVPGEQTAALYVPKSYNGKGACGVCVDIRPVNAGSIPLGYRALADKYNFIWISPNMAGNNVEPLRRWALALDSLATVKQDFRVEGERVFLNGFSGGGVIAINLLMLYPEYFKGVICHARGVYLVDTPGPERRVFPRHFSYLSRDDLTRVAALRKKWIFISGPGDPNYSHIVAALPQWKGLGFDAMFIDVPGLGHADAPPQFLEDALNLLPVN